MEKYFAVHMKNNKTEEEQIQKVKSENVNGATSKRFFSGSEWSWTGSEPWHNVEGEVEIISGLFYRKI